MVNVNELKISKNKITKKTAYTLIYILQYIIFFISIYEIFFFRFVDGVNSENHLFLLRKWLKY